VSDLRHRAKIGDWLGLRQSGPLVMVDLLPHPAAQRALAAAGRPARPRRATMLVDTGAQGTMVEYHVAEALGVRAVRHEQVIGVSQKPEQCPVYPLQIEIALNHGPGGPRAWRCALDTFGMAASKMDSDLVGFLGRDFLAHFRLVYDGRGGTVELFPYEIA